MNNDNIRVPKVTFDNIITYLETCYRFHDNYMKEELDSLIRYLKSIPVRKK